MTNPITQENFEHESLLNILLSLSSIKESHTPYTPLIRENLPLDVTLPTVIENPLFLMAFADNAEYLVSTLLTMMQQFTAEEIHVDQFAQTLKERMRPDDDPESTFQFDYINWYITHYNVFEE